jgi:modulator of FtsH protease HflC
MIRRDLRRILACTLILLVVVALLRSFLIVEEGESVHVTQFGRPVRLIEQPGLHFKWPYQSARSFDRRLQLDAPPPREMLTRDKKNLEVAWYASWRIADVDRFLRTVRTLPEASARLEDMAASVVAAELGLHELGSLVSVTEHSALDAMMSALTRRIGDQAAHEYGLDVVAVRLRRLNYPEEVRTAVFEQIRSERQRVAAATRAEGESQARVIKSAADRERAALVALAEADAARQIGEGEAQAARIANEAQGVDPSFFEFLKTLETYRAALDSKTTLVLSADSHFLRLLTQGPLPLSTEKGAGGQPSHLSAGSGAPLATSSHAEASARSLEPSGVRSQPSRATTTTAREGDKQ